MLEGAAVHTAMFAEELALELESDGERAEPLPHRP